MRCAGGPARSPQPQNLAACTVHHGVVVVEQKITSGEDPGIARTGAAAFRVVQDHVASVFRHEDLASALAATELTEDDLVD